METCLAMFGQPMELLVIGLICVVPLAVLVVVGVLVFALNRPRQPRAPCPHCGAPTEPWANFCPNCGRPRNTGP
jgi:hypothetical protein